MTLDLAIIIAGVVMLVWAVCLCDRGEDRRDNYFARQDRAYTALGGVALIITGVVLSANHIILLGAR